MKTKIGVLCPSQIAYRRFMPALKMRNDFEYIGVAVADSEEWFGGKGNYDLMQKSEYRKAEEFQKEYGGQIFSSYSSLIENNQVEALYIPLPPALHFYWAKFALNKGKHVLVEKPCTTCLDDTQKLIALAQEKNCVLHENYMFVFHSQISFIQNYVQEGHIGDIRLYRIAFGFPFRGAQDFRYQSELGGGALLDCGGYTIKLAQLLMGNSTRVVDAQLTVSPKFAVDIYGNAVLRNDNGVTAQVSFGMDNSYKCELEIWGSKGCLRADRIFTAPVDFSPTLHVEIDNTKSEISLPSDNQFNKSLEYFSAQIAMPSEREKSFEKIIHQSQLVETILRKDCN